MSANAGRHHDYPEKSLAIDTTAPILVWQLKSYSVGTFHLVSHAPERLNSLLGTDVGITCGHVHVEHAINGNSARAKARCSGSHSE